MAKVLTTPIEATATDVDGQWCPTIKVHGEVVWMAGKGYTGQYAQDYATTDAEHHLAKKLARLLWAED